MLRRLKVGALALLCAAVTGGVLWAIVEASDTAPVSDVGLVPPSRPATPPQAVPNAVQKAQARQPEAPLDLAGLRLLCGRAWIGAFGPECLRALAHRNAAMPAVPDPVLEPVLYFLPSRAMLDPVLFGRPPTWGEVFDDPEGTLARVEEAVARPECLPEGRFRLDLRETCAADDMARLALARRECANVMFQLGYSHEEAPGVWGDAPVAAKDRIESRQQDWDRGIRLLDKLADTAEYHERRERLEVAWFGTMWRMRKCRDLPREVFRALGPFRAATGWPQHGQETGMLHAAAQLGSDAALSVLVNGVGSFAFDEAAVVEVRAERPVVEQLLRMRAAMRMSFGSDAVRRRGRVTMIAHALAALALADAVGERLRADAVWAAVARAGLVPREERRGARVHPVRPPERNTAMPHAARWLIDQGWAVVVAAGEDGPERVFERAGEVWSGDPWGAWWDAGRVSLRANGATAAPEG